MSDETPQNLVISEWYSDTPVTHYTASVIHQSEPGANLQTELFYHPEAALELAATLLQAGEALVAVFVEDGTYYNAEAIVEWYAKAQAQDPTLPPLDGSSASTGAASSTEGGSSRTRTGKAGA